MIRLNLLPDIKQEFLRAKRSEKRVIGIAILAMMIAVGLVIVVAIFVYGAQELHKNLLTEDIKKNGQKLKDVKDVDKYVTIQNQLTNLATMHDKKNITSRVFDVIPKLNPKQPNSMKIVNLRVDTAAMQMTITGETATYTGLQTFRDTLTNAKLSYRESKDAEAPTETQLFSDVVIESQGLGSREDSGEQFISFEIRTTYDPSLFARSIVDLNIIVPFKETTQSKLDTPDVFSGATTGGTN